MKKLAVFLLLVPLAGGVALGQSVHQQDSAILAYKWNPSATSYTYCRLLGLNGDPLGAALPGPGLIETVGSNTHFVESVTGANPFAALAVGDIVVVRATDGVTYKRVITVKGSDADITVDTATDLGTVGVPWSYWDFTCGTAATDGWLNVGPYTTFTVVYYLPTKGSTSIDTQVECKIQDSNPYAVDIQNRAAIGTYSYTNSAEAWEQCRVGVKVNTDGADVLSIWFSRKW